MKTNDQDGLIEGIAPKTLKHLEATQIKEFKPWHKPRKQWVRSEQWQKETERLLLKLNLDGRPLRYLTLPGEDMFDIRLLADTCKKKSIELRYLGYDSSAGKRIEQTEINISRNEISKNIKENSVIMPDKFSILKNRESLAYRYLKSHGPFDIINLDLCDSISDLDDSDNHEALKNLCEFQVNNSRTPWLLFLTTRAEYSKVNKEHFPSYIKCIQKNAKKSINFHSRLKDITTFDINIIDNNFDFGAFDGIYFVKLFATGFSKWLLHLFYKKLKIEMLDSCYYRVENNKKPDSFPNMLSLAFCLSPVNDPLKDKSGLTRSNPRPKIDEVEISIKLLEKINCFLDLDIEVDKNPKLYEKLLNESIELLRKARYQVDDYPKWADNEKILFKKK